MQRQRAGDLDGRAEVVHPIGIAGGLAVAIQRTADGRIAIAVDQAAVGVAQLAHADVQALARGHGAGLGHPGHGLGTVEQGASGDGDVIPIHPPAAHVVQDGRLQLRQRAVDQTPVGQLPAGLHVGDALTAQLPAGGVVHIGGRQIQIVRAQHALVAQIAVGVHGQVAVGDQLPGIGQGVVQVQAQIALGLHLSIAAERTRGYELVALRAQHAAGVGDRIGARGQAAGRGDLPSAVVQGRAHLHAAAAIAQQLALLVVQRLRLQLQLPGLHAQRVAGGEGVAVVQRGRGEAEQAIGRQ